MFVEDRVKLRVDRRLERPGAGRRLVATLAGWGRLVPAQRRERRVRP